MTESILHACCEDWRNGCWAPWRAPGTLEKSQLPLQHHHHHHLRRVCGARSQGGGQGGTMDREGEQAGTRSRGLSALAATGIAYAHNFLRRTVLG